MLLAKIKSRLSFRRVLATLILGVLISVKVTGILSAQSVTRGYGSDQVLQRGMIVGTQKKDNSKVEAIDSSRINNILGVVVNPNDSPITISQDKEHIFVATNDRYDVLVDDQNGAIKPTDYVSLSSVAGIGMKANDTLTNVLGRAVEGFDGKTSSLGSLNLKDSRGREKTVHIARIKVDVLIIKNPLLKQSDNTPAFLSKAGEAIAGRSVSPLRLYLSAIIFLVGTIIAGAIIYAGVKSSIISIGRNPLSKRSVFRSLIGVTITGLIVFLISAIGVYLLLKV